MRINCYVQINAKGNPFDNTEGDVPVFFDKESAIVVDENINIKKAILIWDNDKNEVEKLKSDVQTWKAICESYEAKYYDDRREIVDLKKEIDTLNTDYSEEVKRLNYIIKNFGV